MKVSQCRKTPVLFEEESHDRKLLTVLGENNISFQNSRVINLDNISRKNLDQYENMNFHQLRAICTGEEKLVHFAIAQKWRLVRRGIFLDLKDKINFFRFAFKFSWIILFMPR